MSELARPHVGPGLPRGRNSLPPDVVGSAQRDRLLRAMIAATAEHGYAGVMIADVVRRAKVSRNAFYAHFADKESCFLAAVDVGVELMFGRIEDAVRDEADAVARLHRGLGAYLRFLADEPEFAWTFLVEAPGPAARARFVAAHERFAAVNRAWYADLRRRDASWPEVPDDVFVALVGAVHELVAARVRARAAAELPALEDTVVRLHVALLRGWAGRD
jgi:AcrR family transcriptional regulator